MKKHSAIHCDVGQGTSRPWYVGRVKWKQCSWPLNTFRPILEEEDSTSTSVGTAASKKCTAREKWKKEIGGFYSCSTLAVHSHLLRENSCKSINLVIHLMKALFILDHSLSSPKSVKWSRKEEGLPNTGYQIEEARGLQNFISIGIVSSPQGDWVVVSNDRFYVSTFSTYGMNRLILHGVHVWTQSGTILQCHRSPAGQVGSSKNCGRNELHWVDVLRISRLILSH